eukprot:tig00020553_g10645.t1
MFGGLNDIIALDKLLGSGAKREEEPQQQKAQFSSPADIAALAAPSATPALPERTQPSIGAGAKSKSIWEEDQVPDADDATIPEDDDASDTREMPQHEILFRQSVKSEDVFLGMNGKDGSSRHCEELLVRVTLPDTKYSSIELDTSKTVIRVLCPKYKLRLSLPYPVDHKNGSAKWDAAKCVLSIALPRIRDPEDVLM